MRTWWKSLTLKCLICKDPPIKLAITMKIYDQWKVNLITSRKRSLSTFWARINKMRASISSRWQSSNLIKVTTTPEGTSSRARPVHISRFLHDLVLRGVSTQWIALVRMIFLRWKTLSTWRTSQSMKTRSCMVAKQLLITITNLLRSFRRRLWATAFRSSTKTAMSLTDLELSPNDKTWSKRSSRSR